jgi:membrane-associated protein
MRKLPLVPLSALFFYLMAMFFWNQGYIPEPAEMLNVLEGFYQRYQLTGLFVITFLEGLVYFGLYFPGSFIIGLAVVFSNGTPLELIMLSLTTSAALSAVSALNYFLGRILKNRSKNREFNFKTFLAAHIHPNTLAFYYFALGVDKKPIKNLIFTPLISFVYALPTAFILFALGQNIEQAAENEFFMIAALTLWALIAYFRPKKKAKVKI